MKKEINSVGAKSYQRKDKEDRSLAYRNWRREAVARGKRRSTCYTSDIDQVEYVIVKDVVYPVALFEITRYDFDEYDGPSQGWAKYRNAILDRYFHRDAQGKFMQKMSELIGVPAYIVLFRHDLESFWIFDMCHRDALWIHKDADEYREWLGELKTNAVENIKKVEV